MSVDYVANTTLGQMPVTGSGEWYGEVNGTILLDDPDLSLNLSRASSGVTYLKFRRHRYSCQRHFPR